LIKEFGSEEKAFEFAAKQIKDNDKQSFNYFKLLIEYAYGKPTENINNNISLTDFSIKEVLGFDKS
jgi:hypothetical protein